MQLITKLTILGLVTCTINAQTPPQDPLLDPTNTLGDPLTDPSNTLASSGTLEAATITAKNSRILPLADPKLRLLTDPADTPRSIEVVTREEFTQRGAQNIEDALSYTSGVIAGAFGDDSRLDTTRVRGLSPLKFHDGFQHHFGFYNNTRPDIYTLESIEVVKGPASVLYGRGAVAGIVNSNSKIAKHGTHRELKLEYGRHDRRQAALDINESLLDDTLHFRLVTLTRDSGTQVDFVEDDANVLMPSLTWTPTEDTSLTFLFQIQDNDGGQSIQFLPNQGTLLPGRRIPTSTFIGEPGWDRYDTNQTAYSLFFDHQLTDELGIEINGRYVDGEAAYYAHWVAYVPEPVIRPDGTVARTQYISDATSQVWSFNTALTGDYDYHPAINHKFRLGADFVDSRTDNTTTLNYASGGDINIYNPTYGNLQPIGPAPDTPTSVQEQFGITLSNHLTLWDRLILNGGMRYDRLVTDDGSTLTTDNEWTFDAAVMYQFDNGLSPYYSYAESFEPLGQTFETGEQLRPKFGTQHEIGIKYQPTFTQAIFTASWFHIEEQNRPVGNGINLTQSGEARTLGVELDAKWQAHPDLFVTANWTYLDTEDRSLPGDPRLAAIPEYGSSAWITYEPVSGPLEGFRAGFGARYVSNTWDGADNLTSDDHLLYDAMIGYRWNDLDLQLSARNLADESFVATTQGGRAFYGDRRTVDLSLTYTF